MMIALYGTPSTVFAEYREALPTHPPPPKQTFLHCIHKTQCSPVSMEQLAVADVSSDTKHTRGNIRSVCIPYD